MLEHVPHKVVIDMTKQNIKSETQERPLITFALFAYNQEKYIREAVESAFSQIYSPLEIILSDDCSSDKTFEIMQDLVEHYDGPHKVIINRNRNNLGIGGHVNRLRELGSGEWFVFAAGDDVSEQNRVFELYSAINRHSTGVSAVFSRAHLIDDSGREVGLQAPNRPEYVPPLSGHYSVVDLLKASSAVSLGATAAWRNKVLDWPCPLDKSVIGEDSALSVRAMMKSGVLYCKKALVRRRVHENNLSAAEVDWSDCHSRFQEQLKRARMHAGLMTSICVDIISCIGSGKHYNEPFVDELKSYRDLAWERFYYLNGSKRYKLANIFRIPRIASSIVDGLGLILLIMPGGFQQLIRNVRYKKKIIVRHS